MPQEPKNVESDSFAHTFNLAYLPTWHTFIVCEVGANLCVNTVKRCAIASGTLNYSL